MEMNKIMASRWASIMSWFDNEAHPQPVAGDKGIDWARVLPFIALHLGCLGVIWVGISTAAVMVAAGALYAPEAFGIGKPGLIKAASLIEMALGVAIGAITFTGSIIAFLKLDGRMSGKPIMLPSRHLINLCLAGGLVFLIVLFVTLQSHTLFWAITLASFALGVLIIIPIGGADMPVVVSMLNSYSGWAAAGIGFTLGNMALIITGALVGSSGAILSYIMCKGMNRSFISVILGGFGGESAGPAGAAEETRPIKQGSADDAATKAFLARYPKAITRDLGGNSGKLTEADALVAYLQLLGTEVDFKLYDDKANIR